MRYSTIPAAQLMVLSCKAAGIQDIIIYPGSRNAPLTLSYIEDDFFNCYSIVDERCAAFFALGIAQNQNRPTALVCTSGSALLNYYPAIAEAFYSDIPLVVISADRPPYKIDVGDGQTIRQDNVFNRHIGYSANLKIDAAHAVERLSQYWPAYLENPQSAIIDQNGTLIQQAFKVAFEKKLPVHINIPFEEPLYELEKIQDYKLPRIQFEPEKSNQIDFTELSKVWNCSKRKMILVGVNPPNSIEKQILDVLANDPCLIVFTESTSNIHHENFFPSIDSIIFPIEKSKNTDERFLELQPEILLTFGGLVVSKKVKVFLRKYKPKYHWHVNSTKAYDTYFALTKHYMTEPNFFMENLLVGNSKTTGTYFKVWSEVKQLYKKEQYAYLEQIPFSDFSVFDTILKKIPKNNQLHLSNSSTVRYAQLFDIDPSLQVFCNRGTSGIDGSTSTALGSSLYNKAPTLLITGDLSFFYDSNALWNDYIRNDFRIIIINNQGGGIFRILPGIDDSERFGTFFETRHQLTAEHNCAQFGWAYASCDSMNALNEQLSDFFEPSERPKLLEIFTPRGLNNNILLDYFDFISSRYH
ncbi:MAG: 2-succinyl-5-enolpyruvyl-6-hydroxy-3-cyclohexene-1-carboxylic-acid synthase [Croceivirga sp.]